MDTEKCSYCQKRQLKTLFVKIYGLYFCNRGHFKEYIREKPIEPVQMDMFPSPSQQPLQEAEPIKPMLNDCPRHKAFEYSCRLCNPR